MTTANIALLEDRGVIAVTGEDAGKFLQGLITNDLGLLERQSAVFAALLAPQGKILFDFLVVKSPDGYLLDVAKNQAAALTKRLSMYKLRAKVAISSLPDQAVCAPCGPDAPGTVYADPRSSIIGWRTIVENASMAGPPASEYPSFRIDLGIPEGGKDFAWGEVFPHEANMDVLHGVSFEKGCYVGQEIVSRMEHRGTARRRFVRVVANAPLPPAGTEVQAGDVTIGAMGSSAGGLGLALLRLDRVVEFEDQGIPLTAAAVTIAPRRDDLVRFGMRAESAAP